MAAAQLPETGGNFREEFLTCSICTESFDNADHQAKCLPCLHTYCKLCLQKIVEGNSELNCPQCRQTVSLPEETVDSLQNNFIVENLKEYQNILNFAVICRSCDAETQAVKFCYDCGLFVCKDCDDGHKKLRILQHHRLVTIEELQAKKCNPLLELQPHCKTHPKQDMTMFCQTEDCKIPVCATCGHLDHRRDLGHDLVELSTAIQEIKVQMQQLTVRAKDRKNTLASTRLVAEKQKDTLTANFKRRLTEMQQFLHSLHNMINHNYYKAHSEMKELYEQEVMNLTTTIESIDSVSGQLTTACEFADQSLDLSHMQLLQSQKHIVDRLDELDRVEQPHIANPMDKSNFEFTKEHFATMKHVEESLKDFCQIRWKAQLTPRQCTIQFGLASEQMDRKKAIIETIDGNGCKMTTGGAQIEVTQDAVTYVVQDNNNGTYSFVYDKTSKSPLCVKINGAEISGSPFDIPALESQVDPVLAELQVVPTSDQNTAPLHPGVKMGDVQSVKDNGQQVNASSSTIETLHDGPQQIVQDNPSQDRPQQIVQGNPSQDGPQQIVQDNTSQDGPQQIVQDSPSQDRPQQVVQGNHDSMNASASMLTTQIQHVHAKKDGSETTVSASVDPESMNASASMVTAQTQNVHAQNDACETTVSLSVNNPTKIDPTQCTINTGLPSKLGWRKAIITTMDSDGHRMTAGGASVQAIQSKYSWRAEDNKDGTYAINYTSNYASKPLYVQINGIEMEGSPFNTHPHIDPQQCTVQLGLPTDSQERYKAVICLVDCDGHKMTTSCNAMVKVTRGDDELDIADNKDGTYTIDYTLKVDSPPLDVRVNGGAIHGSPFSTLPEVDVERCTIKFGETEGHGWKKAIVKLVDSHGREMTAGGAEVEAWHGGYSADVADNDNGTYTIDCNSYWHEDLIVKINGKKMQGSPFHVP